MMCKLLGKLAGIVMMLFLVINAQGQSVTGKVTDAGGQPLASVSVQILNTGFNVISDEKGDFHFGHIAEGAYTIQLTAVGYASQAETFELKKDETKSLSFKLNTSMVQLEAVTVTAEKKEALLQKTALSISAIAAKQVEEYRLWNIKDITAIVPNFASGNSGDERNVSSIRGITTTSYDPAVATYIDGVNQFSLDTYIPQLNDIERIEVLRGPQGTLYGRNAMAGVINIITKKPGNTTTGFAELNVGNYGLQRYSVGFRTPLVKDKLYVGASLAYNKRDGCYTNTFDNSSFDKQSGLSGNYYIRYLPSEKWKLTLNVKHQNNLNDGAFPLVNGVDEAFANPYKLNQNAVGRMVDNTLNASLSVQHTGDKLGFSSQLSWQNNHRYYKSPLDGDFSPLDAVTIINDYGKQWNNVKVLTHELRFNSPAGKSSLFNWTAGTYFFYQNNPNKQATHFGKDGSLLGAPDSASSISTSTAKNTGIAVFGQATYMLTKKLGLIAGLRYDFENKYLTVRGEYQPDGQQPFVTTPDTSATAKFSALSPKIGLQLEINKHSNGYLSYSRGYRTGGLTQLSSDPSQPPLYPYKPEYSNNIELGIKNSFLNNRLYLNVAAFLTYVSDAQVPTLILPDAITVTKNTGKLTSKGAELEMAFKPVKGLQLDYNLGFTDASYQSLKIGSNGQSTDLAGKKQIFTPDMTSLLAIQYAYTINEKHRIRLLARGEWYYLGKEYFDLANTISQSAHGILNSRIGISLPHLELFFWARNITDKKYIEYAYDFGAVHLGNPKTYGLTLRASF
jgi:iron complex outermembrane receptor protein